MEQGCEVRNSYLAASRGLFVCIMHGNSGDDKVYRVDGKFKIPVCIRSLMLD